MEIFETTEKVIVKVGEKTISMESPVDLDSIKRIARESNVKKFTVKINGENAFSTDFPVESGTVEIIPYCEAK